MNSKSSKIVIIVMSLMVIALLFSAYFFYSLNSRKKFSALIFETDTLINTGDINKAVSLLTKAVSTRPDRQEYKMVLKRAYRINSLSLMEKVSETAVDKYPDDKLFTSLYIYTLLKSGKFKIAAEFTENIKYENIVESVYLESVIRTGLKISSDSSLYLGVISRKAEIYRDLFRITGNSIFRIDESLIYLERGNFRLAWDAIKNININSPEINQLKFLILYDIGDYDNALKQLKVIDNDFSPGEMDLMESDIYLRTGNFDQAFDKYLSFINLYPDFTWLAYYNYIWIELSRDNQDILETLTTALERYPDNQFLLYELVEYFREKGSKTKSIPFLEHYLQQHPEDTKMKIVLKELKGLSDTKYLINALRTYINDNPPSYQASAYLAWNLIENGQFLYLENFLKEAESDIPKELSSFFSALILAEKGEYESAVETFQTSYKQNPRWETLYNIALLSEYLFNYQSALEYYQKAENSIPDIESNMSIKSEIRTQLAELFYKLGEFQNSYREVKNAIDQDKANLRALLLLKKLQIEEF